MQVTNKIVIILSHCNTDKKKEILLRNTEILRKIPNLEILLTSHITLPQEFTEKFDYFVYDKSNPVLTWPTKTMVYWQSYPYENHNIELSYFVSDYGWTVFNQIKLGYGAISGKNYDKFIFMNYDLEITDELISEINDEIDYNKIYHVKAHGGQKSFPSLIFFTFDKKNASKLYNLLDFEVYRKYEYAERFFESIIQLLEYKKMDITNTDQVDFNNRAEIEPFNNSLNDDYQYYMGYDNPEKKGDLRYFFYRIKNKIIIKNGDEIIEINEGQRKLIVAKEELKILNNDSFELIPFKDNNNIQLIKIK